MADAHLFTELVEAVADGRQLDWNSIAEATATDDERAEVEALRELAGIGEIYATLSRSSGATPSGVSLEPGSTWGGLRVIERVGAGRYGAVYRAWDPTLDRHVALKVLNVDEKDDLLETQVIDEGRLMARVRHPNVATIHGALRIDGVTGLWMEFVEGRTLADELAGRGPFDAAEIVAVGTQLARALAAVHSSGLVHRDVKASNVLRDDTGRVVLGDFGTGRELDEPVETLEGLAGTPAYLAPEVFRGQPATPQSDVYSLGVLLFHLASREYPYAARSLRDLRDAHSAGRGTPLGDRRPDLPAALTRLVDSALDPDPSRRPQSASALADGLETCLADRARQRHRKTVVAVVAASVLMVTVVAWGAWRPRPAPFNFSARDWVLVAAFDNRSGNPALDGTLEYALELELADSSFVRVVPRERIQDTLALMRRPLDSHVDATVGREVAVRDGQIRALVAGQVSRIGESYRLTARVLNPADGSIVASVVETSNDDRTLLEAIARVAAKVRVRLGETLPNLPPSGASLPKVSTRSLKALQLYAQALPDLFFLANPAAAEPLLLAAVAEDPEFAVGYAALARCIREQHFSLGDTNPTPEGRRRADIIEHLDRAVALADRASLMDQYIITAESERIRADFTTTFVQTPGGPGGRFLKAPDQQRQHLERALAAAQAWHQVQPENVQAVLTLMELNREMGGRPSAIVPFARELVVLRPHNLDALKRAAYALTDVGLFDEARQYLYRTRPLLALPVPDNRGFGPEVDARTLLFEDAWRRNDMKEAVAMAEALAAIQAGAEPVAAGLLAAPQVFVHITLGQFSRAEKVAATIRRQDGMKELRMASVVVRRKRPGEAREFLAKTFPNPTASLETNLLLILVDLAMEGGDLRLARRAIEVMRVRRAPPDFLEQSEGKLALLEGNPERAIERLAPLCTDRPDHTMDLRCTLLARSFLAKGNTVEAIRVLERISSVPRELRNPRMGGTADNWLTMRDLLAQLHRQVGREKDAEPLEAELRLLLSVADADHPIKRRLDALKNQ